MSICIVAERRHQLTGFGSQTHRLRNRRQASGLLGSFYEMVYLWRLTLDTCHLSPLAALS